MWTISAMRERTRPSQNIQVWILQKTPRQKLQSYQQAKGKRRKNGEDVPESAVFWRFSQQSSDNCCPGVNLRLFWSYYGEQHFISYRTQHVCGGLMHIAQRMIKNISSWSSKDNHLSFKMTAARASKPLLGHWFTLTGEHKVIKIGLEILQQRIKLKIWPVMKGIVTNSD